MKLAGVKVVHDFIVEYAIKQFNATGGLPPTMFIAEISDEGAVKHASGIPTEISGPFFKPGTDPSELNDFLSDLLTEGGELRARIEKDTGAKVNLVIQVNEGWMQHPDNPGAEQEILLFLIHQPEGTFPVAHHILNEPMRHCVQSEFPPAEKIRFKKGAFKRSLPQALDRSKLH